MGRCAHVAAAAADHLCATTFVRRRHLATRTFPSSMPTRGDHRRYDLVTEIVSPYSHCRGCVHLQLVASRKSGESTLCATTVVQTHVRKVAWRLRNWARGEKYLTSDPTSRRL
jgi:hypothetical protein